MWLTRLALRNPVFILMMSLMTIVLGVVSLRRLSVDLFPEINVPVIRVATFYTGAGPADIEKSITEPIERAVGASPGVDRVESQSRQGFSSVSVWFNYGVNLDNAQFEVSQRVALRARGLGILEVVDAVRQSNLLLPSGHLKAGARDYNVFSNTQVAQARPLGEVIVRGGAAAVGSAPGGAAAVRVSDIAEVE